MAGGLLYFFGRGPARQVYVTLIEFPFGSRWTLHLIVEGMDRLLNSPQSLLFVKGRYYAEFLHRRAGIVVDARLVLGGHLDSSGHLKHLRRHLPFIVLFTPW